MRYIVCITFGLLLSMLCVIGKDLPSVDTIRGLPALKSRTLVYGTGFDDPADPKIKLLEGFRWARGEGVNGNAAIRVDRVGDASKGSHWAVINLDGADFSPAPAPQRDRCRQVLCRLPFP